MVRREQALHVLPYNITFDVYSVPRRELAERRVAKGVLDERDANRRRVEKLAHSEAHAVERDRAPGHGEIGDKSRQRDVEEPRITSLADVPNLSHPIDVPLDNVAAKRVAEAQGALQIDAATRPPI